MSETVEVRVARLEENMKFLVDNAKLDRDGRKAQYDSIKELSQAVQLMSADMKTVKERLDGQAPTIQEFITIKHKVEGAGKLGKMIWVAGAFIIGFIFANRERIFSWMAKI